MPGRAERRRGEAGEIRAAAIESQVISGLSPRQEGPTRQPQRGRKKGGEWAMARCLGSPGRSGADEGTGSNRSSSNKQPASTGCTRGSRVSRVSGAGGGTQADRQARQGRAGRRGERGWRCCMRARIGRCSTSGMRVCVLACERESVQRVGSQGRHLQDGGADRADRADPRRTRATARRGKQGDGDRRQATGDADADGDAAPALHRCCVLRCLETVGEGGERGGGEARHSERAMTMLVGGLPLAVRTRTREMGDGQSVQVEGAKRSYADSALLCAGGRQ